MSAVRKKNCGRYLDAKWVWRPPSSFDNTYSSASNLPPNQKEAFKILETFHRLKQ